MLPLACLGKPQAKQEQAPVQTSDHRQGCWGPSQQTQTSGFRWGGAHHRRPRHLDSYGAGPSQETQTSGFRWGGPITGDPDIWIQMGQGPSQETKTSGFRWGGPIAGDPDIWIQMGRGRGQAQYRLTWALVGTSQVSDSISGGSPRFRSRI